MLFNAVFELSRDAWRREPLYASLYGAGTAVSGLCRYGMMTLDAALLTQSVSAIQFPENVDGTRFCLHVAAKVCLSLALMGMDLALNTIVEGAERNVRQTRIREVTASFYKMEFSSMTEANFRRFRDTCANIVRYPTYFKESIQQLCKLAEIGVTALVVCHNIANMTSSLSMFCLAATALNSILVLFGLPLSLGREGFALDKESSNCLNGPKSFAERRYQNLVALTLRDEETTRDIALHGAADWLFRSVDCAFAQIPREKRRDAQRFLNPLVAKMINLVEMVGVPAICIFRREKITFESYHLVQQSLTSICRHASGIQDFINLSLKQAVPYEKEFFGCVRMGAIGGRSCAAQDLDRLSSADIKRLEVRDVYFQYSENSGTPEMPLKEKGGLPLETKPDKTVLRGISFTFERGKVYSIIGSNGGGKTTLVNLLTKLYSPSQGSVLVNDVDLSTVPSSDWLKRLAVAPQEFSQLHTFTIRENIGVGQTTLLEKDPEAVIVQEAAKGAIASFVELEAYYGMRGPWNQVPGSENETWKGDFSGGQWQSIALARTLCRTSDRAVQVLILDEPTSALDPMAEHRLFERLRQEKEQRITIFISHRLQTARASDCILVMEKGALIQHGTHDELIADSEGLYSRMYRL